MEIYTWLLSNYLFLIAATGILAIVIHLAILYFVIKVAVRNGIQEAREDIKEDQKNGYE